ncbi:MAG: hypothetical protein ACOYXB_14000 [Bacteroidota bacterium]
MKPLVIIGVFLSFLFWGCRSNSSDTGKIDMNQLLDENGAGDNLSISEESLYAIIESFPSPLEIASLIKESGVVFNEGLLSSTGNADKYTTDQERALAMGIYTGNLGYINVYEKSYLALKYLGTIKGLADELNVGQFFDFETIGRLSSNSDKIDSLIYLSTLNFEKMDRYLRSQKRSNLSVLLVTGTWIESLFLATQVVSAKPNETLVERIAEQKMILDQVMVILSVYQNEELFGALITNLNELKKEFDQVTITYNYAEPTTKEVNGRLVIVDNSTTEVNITDAQVKSITAAIGQIREKIVNNALN